MYRGEPIRLVSVKVDKLVNKNEIQISLFDAESKLKQQKLDETIDKLKEKYGYLSITRAGKLEIGKNIRFK